MKTLDKKLSSTELAELIINSKWNCSYDESRAAKILINSNNFTKYLEAEKSRLKDRDFNYYYGEDLLPSLNELYKKEAHPFSFIHTALLKSVTYKGFNWNNFSSLMLMDNDYRELLPTSLLYDFCSNFRGTITQFHKIGKKYVVIETAKNDRDGKAEFYPIKNGTTSMTYDKLEEAIIGAMYDNHIDAAIALLKDSNRSE